MKRVSVFLVALLLLACTLFLSSCGTVVSIGDNGNWFIDGVDTGVFAGESTESEFKPILRFAVTSDIHLRDGAEADFQSRAQLESFLKSIYAYSDADTEYTKLDATLFLGDLTQSGTDREFEDFVSITDRYIRQETYTRAVLGNHEFYTTAYDDGTNEDIRYSDTSVKNTVERFKSYFGYESEDIHTVIGGYHFILLSMDKYDKKSSSFYSQEKLEWLDQEISMAAYDDPSGKKPIFVFHHVPPLGTMLGSLATNSDEALFKLLSHYPQVIDFAGHTHRPANDPRSIWQGNFTALNTGSLAYLGLPISGTSRKDSGLAATNQYGTLDSTGREDLERSGYMYYMVEIGEDNRVRINVCDIRTNKSVGEPIIIKTGNVKNFTYTNDRETVSLRPIWKDGASITVEHSSFGKILISNPQAYSEDTIQNYRVDLFKDGVKKDTVYTLSGSYYGSLIPDRVYTSFSGLDASAEYEIKVYPVNSWGRAGSPLTLSFVSLPKPNEGSVPTADILKTVFNSDGSAVNALTGEKLSVYGSPTVTKDSGIGINVASFDGDDAYAFTDMPYWYSLIGKSFTLETYVYVESAPTKTVGIISNVQNGGFGFEYRKNGNLYLTGSVGEQSVERPNATLKNGEWVHVVGLYTGMELCLYVNGVRVDSHLIFGTMSAPSAFSQTLFIGADSGYNAPENFSQCKIAIANLYSYALSDSEISALYSQLNS